MRLLIPLAALACTGTPTAEPGDGPSGTATVTPDCAPDDGSALLISVGVSSTCGADAPTTPWVRFALWSGLPNADGDSVTLDASLANGNIWYYDQGGDTDWRVLAGASITFDEYDEAGAINGSYEMTLEDTTTLTGTFDATFCDADPQCG
jgi:hypothetical protein